MKNLRINIDTIVLILVFVNALGMVRLLNKKESFPEQSFAYEKKFGEIATHLKLGEPAGYLADGERHPVGANGAVDEASVDLPSMRKFFICQFALAPIILVHSSEPAKVVGNFSSDAMAATEAAARGLKIVQAGPEGAALCEHNNKK